jgi:succinate dehydrogenase / fumarate reductase membrane anchor subunit
MRIGMQVVVEDYIAKAGTKAVILILNTFVCIGLFAVAAFAILKIAG